MCKTTQCAIKTRHFDYNSGVSWAIFYTFCTTRWTHKSELRCPDDVLLATWFIYRSSGVTGMRQGTNTCSRPNVWYTFDGLPQHGVLRRKTGNKESTTTTLRPSNTYLPGGLIIIASAVFMKIGNISLLSRHGWNQTLQSSARPSFVWLTPLINCLSAMSTSPQILNLSHWRVGFAVPWRPPTTYGWLSSGWWDSVAVYLWFPQWDKIVFDEDVVQWWWDRLEIGRWLMVGVIV